MKSGEGDHPYLCIAAIEGDTIVLVTAKDLYAIEERDWEVWVSVAGGREVQGPSKICHTPA